FEFGGENARFNNGDGVGKVDFLNAIHAHKRERNPAAHRYTSPYITKSASARGDRNFLARGELKKLAHVSCRSCKDDNFRRMCREPLITAVRSDCFRIVSDNFAIKDFSKLRSEFHYGNVVHVSCRASALLACGGSASLEDDGNTRRRIY